MTIPNWLCIIMIYVIKINTSDLIIRNPYLIGLLESDCKESTSKLL